MRSLLTPRNFLTLLLSVLVVLTVTLAMANRAYGLANAIDDHWAVRFWGWLSVANLLLLVANAFCLLVAIAVTVTQNLPATNDEPQSTKEPTPETDSSSTFGEAGKK